MKGPDLIAWCVTERVERSFWTRIGAAWDHQNGARAWLDGEASSKAWKDAQEDTRQLVLL